MGYGIATTPVRRLRRQSGRQQVGVEPWEYLRDLFCLLPAWPAHRVLELAPAYWAGTREREGVEALLAADPYRAATL